MTDESRRKIILKPEDYKYPSAEERAIINKDFPKLECFNFPYVNEIEETLTGKLPMDDASRLGNLHEWDRCLLNRFGSLQRAYINMMTHFNRGFPEDFTKCEEGEHINRILFDNYAEAVYYYFMSSMDILAQILNLYYRMNLSESNVGFKRSLFKKLGNTRLKEMLVPFYDQTEETREIRNCFAHRYTPVHADFRSFYIEEGDRKKLGIGYGESYSSEKIVENSEMSIQLLAKLMLDLIPQML